MKFVLREIGAWVAVATVASYGAGCATSASEGDVPRVEAPPAPPIVVAAAAPVAAPPSPPSPGPSNQVLAEAPAPSPESAPSDPNAVRVVNPTEVQLRDGLKELVTLAERGLGDEVLIAWIKNQARPIRPTSDEIVYLTDLGISEEVVKVLIERGGGVAASAPTTVHPSAPMVPAQVPTEPAATVTATPEFQAAPQTPVEQPPAPAVAAAPTVVQHQYFYSSLAPYGSWVEVADYGLVWRPTVAVVDTGWRPYCNGGRWLYTSAGWYWQSDYSWGWAPFHYGRWWRHPGCGWVWRPDSVWGPAWVTWRFSDAYCGWAPLPPACGFRPGFGLTYHSAGVSVGFGFGFGYDYYNYVPIGRFCDRNPWRHRLGGRNVEHVHNRTKVINNITYNNNTIINEGISRDRVARISRSEIRKVELRDEDPRAVSNPRSIRSDRLDQSGSTLAVYRPVNDLGRGAAGRSEVSRPSATSATTATIPGMAGPRPMSGGGQPRPVAGDATTVGGSRLVPSQRGSAPSAETRAPASQPGAAGTPYSRPIASRPNSAVPTPAPNVRGGTPALQSPTTPTPAAVPGGVAPKPGFNERSSGAAPVANPVPSTPRINPAPASRPAQPSRLGSYPGSGAAAPANQGVIRSLPSESGGRTPEPVRSATTPIQRPLVSQNPVPTPRSIQSTPNVTTLPNSQNYYRPTPTPAPQGIPTPRVQPIPSPGFRQEVPRSSPTPQYVQPRPSPAFAPQSSGPVPVQSVPSYRPAPAPAPVPSGPPPAARPAPTIRSEPSRAGNSNPQPVTSRPVPSRRDDK